MQQRRELPPEKASSAAILGANVYRLRVMRGLRGEKLSQAGLGRLAGVTVNTISAIEGARDPGSGVQSNPRLGTIEAIADVLGATVAQLLREDDETRVFLRSFPSLSLVPA